MTDDEARRGQQEINRLYQEASAREQKQRHRERRERIATAALQGYISTHAHRVENCVYLAVQAADALIARLDEE